MDAGTLMLIGTGIQAGSKIAGGYAANEAAQYNARGLEARGTEEFAASQRAAEERRREARLVESRQIALGAASGAGAGPSLLDIIGDTAARGEYQAHTERYGGEARRNAYYNQAAASRYQGRNAFIGSILEGIGTAATGGMRYNNIYGPTTSGTRIPPFRTTTTYG